MLLKEGKMKIEFELNEKQTEVLNELLALPQNKGKEPNEACKGVIILALIEVKQILIKQELTS